MKKIIFELIYFTTIGIIGLYSGYYVSRYSIEILNKSAGFVGEFFLNTNKNEEIKYEK
jgi:hypothetical protein